MACKHCKEEVEYLRGLVDKLMAQNMSLLNPAPATQKSYAVNADGSVEYYGEEEDEEIDDESTV